MGGGLCHRRDWIGLSTGMALTDGRRKKTAANQENAKKKAWKVAQNRKNTFFDNCVFGEFCR